MLRRLWRKLFSFDVVAWVAFGVFFLITYRVFFLRHFDAMGHNWDATLPGLSELLTNSDFFWRHAWNRMDLGAPSYFTTVHMVANVAVKYLAYLLPVRWIIALVLLTVHGGAFISSKYLLDRQIKATSLNYLPAALYAFSPFLFNMIIAGSWYLWLSYAFLPLYVSYLLAYLSTGKYKFLLALCVVVVPVLFSTQYFVLTSVIVFIHVICLLLAGLLRWKKTLLRVLIFAGLFVVLSAYWMLGAGFEARGIVDNLVLDDTISGGWGSVELSTQVLPLLLSLAAFWNRHLYLYALSSVLFPFFIISVGLVWMLVVVHLFVRSRNKNYQLFLFWFLPLLCLLFLAKGPNLPWGEATMRVYYFLPVLKIFRTPYHWLAGISLLLSLLLAFAWQAVYRAGLDKRVLFAVGVVVLCFWTSGWWLTGDLSQAALRFDNRDHVDFYKLAPDLKAYYQRNQAALLQHRSFFLPAVYSPFFLANDYQETGQGAIPEYPYLRQPTFTSERVWAAQFVDASFCHELALPLVPFLSFFNVSELIARNDVLPAHTNCAFGPSPARAHGWSGRRTIERLQNEPGLKQIAHGPTITRFEVDKDRFLPLFYTPTEITVAQARNIELPRLLQSVPRGVRASWLLTEFPEALPEALREKASLVIPYLQLQRGKVGVHIPDSAVTEKRNLLTDASFESGVWNEKPIDCNTGQPAAGLLGQEPSTDATDGVVALELGSDIDNQSCAYRSFAVSLQADRLYLLSFDYKSISGNEIQFSFHVADGHNTTTGDKLHVSDQAWHRYEALVVPKAAAEALAVFFNAPASVASGETVARYDNVQLIDLMPKTEQDIVVEHAAAKELQPPSLLVYRAASPARYRVQAFGVTDSFLLTFLENWHPAWKLYPVPHTSEPAVSEFDQTSRFLLHEEKMSAEPWRAQPAELVRMAARGWLSGIDDGPIQFVSTVLNGSVQNNNMQLGGWWKTWRNDPLPETSHVMTNGYANGWWVDVQSLCHQSEVCARAADGTYTIDFVVEFWPQRLFVIGSIVSIVGWLGLLSTGLWRRVTSRQLYARSITRR